MNHATDMPPRALLTPDGVRHEPHAEFRAAPRVLIVADNVSRKFGGEAAIPYHIFRVLRRRGAECWLVTQERNRDELTSLFAPEDAARIYYVPDLQTHRVLERVTGRLPGRAAAVTTRLWGRLLSQHTARSLVRNLVALHRIEVVHQPTPVSPKEPSLLHDVGAPVVFGPLNGGMEWPPGFTPPGGTTARLAISLLRKAATGIHFLLPAKRHAALVLVANDRTRRALPPGTTARIEFVEENGVDLSLWSHPPSHSTQGAPGDREAPARFAFVGRLEPWKGVHLLLRALRSAADRGARLSLTIIGSGIAERRLRALSSALGLDAQVTFTGWLPQPEAARLLQSHDALVLPSLFDCGGAVILEAMAAGLPVIATRWGGAIDYVEPQHGLLVDPGRGPTDFVPRLADAMLALAADPALRRRLGAAGRLRAEQRYDWDRKIDTFIALYHGLLNEVSAAQSPNAHPDAARGPRAEPFPAAGFD